MSLEQLFQMDEKVRTPFIEKHVAGKVPAEQYEVVKERATKITTMYAGFDIDAMSILAFAAERSRFDEFAEKLERNYRDELQYVHPEARRSRLLSGSVKTLQFFQTCYQAMDIKPRDEV